MWTVYDWRCRVGITEFNSRTIGNFPVQAVSADILRLAIVMADARSLCLLAPVHDALLIEARADRIDSDVALLQDVMVRASRIVLGGNLALRSSAETVKYPHRFTDARGTTIWDQVLELLAAYRQHRDRQHG